MMIKQVKKCVVITVLIVMALTFGFSQEVWDGSQAGKLFYNGGYVGIGTDEPSTILHILESEIASTFLKVEALAPKHVGLVLKNDFVQWNFTNTSNQGKLSLWNSNISDNVATFDLEGNVGIGTTTPVTKLHILETDNKPAYLKVESSFDTMSGLVLKNSATQWNMTNASGAGSLQFWNSDFQSNVMSLRKDGNVVIGASTRPSNLTVHGTINAKKIVVKVMADYVFEDDYALRSLDEVEEFVTKNNHLPDVPSAREIEANGGIGVGEINTLLLQKVEELTLYMIDMKKQNDALQHRITELEGVM